MVALDPAGAAGPVRATGLSGAELDALRRAGLAATDWQQLFTLTVAGADGPAMAAAYRVTASGVELTPAYPLEPGREYRARFDPGRLPTPRAAVAAIEATFVLPPPDPGPPVHVTRITPSSSTWPENTLRFYVYFSGPMSGTSAVDHVQLVDDAGETIRDVLLDVDVDLWNTDYTRRTVFFDPGRVKRDILPNRELGRALVAGRRYAIIVHSSWKDAHGRPLAAEFRHAFVAGPPVETGIEPDAWVITPPRAGTTDPVTIAFDRAIDEGLLHRAIGVTSAEGDPLDGEIRIDEDERRWSFTPARPWSTARAHVVVLSLLEDPQGNTVREAFEFEMFGRPAAAAPERLVYPFTPRPR